MARSRAKSADTPASRPPEATAPRSRTDLLSEGAEAAKRGAGVLLDREEARARTTAGLSAMAGVAALALGCTAALGYGDPRILCILTGIASLVPTAYALSKATDANEQITDVIFERGLCHALSVHARRLGESVGGTDALGLSLSADDIVTAQVDLLFRDLDRSKQRMITAGVDVGVERMSVRPSERLVPDQTETLLVAPDGRRFPVYIAEVALAEITVRGLLPPLLPNDIVHIGARKARLAALGTNRATFHFLTPIVVSELNRKIII